jgi:two-component system, LytTR family, response regulator
MSIHCLIIDDKPLAIDILADYTGKTPFLKLMGSTTNPIEGLSMIRQQPIDLVFLDIQMPELTGIQFMTALGKQCKVILTTAYPEYALQGFEHDVIDYLLKPVSFERFYKAAEKALGFFPTPNTAPEYIFVKTGHHFQKVNIKDILYIESLQNYIVLFTAGEKIMSLQPLKKIIGQLPLEEFVRVHKSYIVSLRHIDRIEQNRILINETVIPIGENYKDQFFKKIS